MLWSRTFVITLAIFFLIVAFFDYYSWSWLQSIGSPIAALEGYNYYSNLAWASLWISSLILLAHANIAFAKTGRPWFFWAAFVYFCFFVVVKYFWLALAEFDFRTANGLAESGTMLGPFVAVFLFVVFGGLVVLNQFAAQAIARRLYPEAFPTPNDRAVGEDLEENDIEENGP